MKILQLAPPWEPVPPPAYGGTETVVANLTEQLVRLGHDVTLWASGDSTTSATLRSTCPRSLRSLYTGDLDPLYQAEWFHVASALREATAGGYDLVHNHAGALPMAFADFIDQPMLSTCHSPIPEATRPIWENYGGYFNTISRSQTEIWPGVPNAIHVGHVYNGIDCDSFPYSVEKDDYLLFLARFSPEKGAHLAIEVAKRLGMRLMLAGKVDKRWGEDRYFEEFVALNVDGVQIQFLGEADARLKRELYAKARCLLLPLQWPEPFGLVMTEAMACGTPVIAFSHGSAPELIVHGMTGFLVSDVDAMAEAVARLDEIEPAACRRHVEQHFSAEAMANAYLEVYERILRTADTKQCRQCTSSAWEAEGALIPAASSMPAEFGAL